MYPRLHGCKEVTEAHSDMLEALWCTEVRWSHGGTWAHWSQGEHRGAVGVTVVHGGTGDIRSTVKVMVGYEPSRDTEKQSMQEHVGDIGSTRAQLKPRWCTRALWRVSSRILETRGTQRHAGDTGYIGVLAQRL